MQPYPGAPDFGAIYRAQIAGMVLSPAARKDGDILLKTNPRNLYLYLMLFLVTLMSPLSYLFFFGLPPVLLIISMIPSLVVLGFALHAFAQMKTIRINENQISFKSSLRRERTYSYDRVTSMTCFPAGKPRPDGTVPARNLMILTFDDKRTLRLPVLMPGYAELFGILSTRTDFGDELAKVERYYFALGIDIRNRCMVTDDVFPDMNGPRSDPGNPFEGF